MSSSGHAVGEEAAIRTDLGAIFVSLELSRRSWLVMSLSPGGEKLSRIPTAKKAVVGPSRATPTPKFTQIAVSTARTA